jgi:hypothetical protein
VSTIRLALALWGGLYLVLGPLHAPGDGDLYWQRWLGALILRTHRLPEVLGSGTFTAPNASWVPQEWLFSLAVALASNWHVFLLFSIAVSALPLAILALVYFRARASASPDATGVALLLCGMALAESFGPRAQDLGWAGLAAFVLFLDRRDRWYYAAFPSAVVWANLHASVALAPLLVLARLAATVADGGLRALRSSRDLFMLPAVALALFCTPLGWRLPYLAISLATSPIRRYIQEWQPPGLHDASFLFGAVPLALAIAFGGRETLGERKLQLFPAATLFLAALMATRNTALFAIVAAPLAAVGLDVRFPGIGRLGSKVRELEPVALPSVAVAIAAAGFVLVQLQRHAPPTLPTIAIAGLAHDNAHHRILCEDFSWCSIALGYPALRVFIDGRCDGYPLPVWQKYIAMVRVSSHWRAPLREYDVDSVLVKRGNPLALAMAQTPHWLQTYSDASFVLYRLSPSVTSIPQATRQ